MSPPKLTDSSEERSPRQQPEAEVGVLTAITGHGPTPPKGGTSRHRSGGRPRVTTPAEDRFLALSARRRRSTTVPPLVADHFVASGRRIFAITVRRRLHNAGLYARLPVVCVPLNGRQRRTRLCWAREHVSWTRRQWASVVFTDESRFTLESDSGHLLIWREQRTRYNQSNTLERHSYRGGGIMVFGQGSHSVVTLICMCSMEEL
ncbi:hypothetical protein AVEN_31287-1 [Araneus ventricosus]|uniref:Transposase Tc1-like domain-containing protein n=1 Tax=Araneus ventricosus TaxID=182803 RepID=A0A4Y2T0Y5_ARAVE|nr:hypothetical protein AVEN_31287-1 [Araneus ventricosus]